MTGHDVLMGMLLATLAEGPRFALWCASSDDEIPLVAFGHMLQLLPCDCRLFTEMSRRRASACLIRAMQVVDIRDTWRPRWLLSSRS